MFKMNKEVGMLLQNGDFYLRYYGDVIHSFDWKSAVEHDGGVQNA